MHISSTKCNIYYGEEVTFYIYVYLLYLQNDGTELVFIIHVSLLS